MTISGFGGTFTIGDVAIPVRAWTLVASRPARWNPILCGKPMTYWYERLVAATPRG